MAQIILDRPRELRLDVAALCAIEDHFKTGISSLLSERMGLSVLCVIFYQGMKKEDKTLTLEKTQALVGDYLKAGGDFESLGSSLNAAIEEAGLGSPK